MIEYLMTWGWEQWYVSIYMLFTIGTYYNEVRLAKQVDPYAIVAGVDVIAFIMHLACMVALYTAGFY